MAQPIQLGSRTVGEGHPVFVIAEVSANHRQNIDVAKEIIRAAANAGADAIKLQTYTADTMTLDARTEPFMVANPGNPDIWKGKSLYELYTGASTPWEWHAELKALTESLGLEFFSSPFDATAVDFLEELGASFYKVASYECTDIPLLKKIASTGKPVIMSVGFATLEEIDASVNALREAGAKDIILLHCVTSYAETPEETDMHFRNIRDLAERFDVVTGFSDNNGGSEMPVLAVAAGARVIEKHVLVHREDGGADARFSLEPDELADMVTRIRGVERALGTVAYGPQSEAERENTQYRRSIFVAKPVKKGETFTPENIRVIRPAHGLEPKYYEEVLGKAASRDLERATPLAWDMIER